MRQKKGKMGGFGRIFWGAFFLKGKRKQKFPPKFKKKKNK